MATGGSGISWGGQGVKKCLKQVWKTNIRTVNLSRTSRLAGLRFSENVKGVPGLGGFISEGRVYERSKKNWKFFHSLILPITDIEPGSRRVVEVQGEKGIDEKGSPSTSCLPLACPYSGSAKQLRTEGKSWRALTRAFLNDPCGSSLQKSWTI